MLSIENLVKEYVRGERVFKAVDNVNLVIEDGDYVNIIGRSGSGKSTLLNMVAGLLTPTSGSIFIDNDDITKYTDAKLALYRNNNIGFVPQGSELISNLNVYNNILLPYFLQKHEGDPHGRVKYLIELLNLQGMDDAYTNELSGGEIKRVLIARALMNSPKVIIADEPTSDLDVGNTKEIMNLFKRINEDKTTVIVVTHELDTLKYGKNVYTMQDGKLSFGNNLVV